MTFEEARIHVSELIGHRSLSSDSVFSIEQQKLIALLYQEFTGKVIRKCNCKNKYTDALIELNYLLTQTKNDNTMKKYILKRGVIFHHEGKTYARQNLTDDVAQAFLKECPGAKWMFENIPEEPASIEEKEETVSANKRPRRKAIAK